MSDGELAEILTEHRLTVKFGDGLMSGACSGCGWLQDLNQPHRSGIELHIEHQRDLWRATEVCACGHPAHPNGECGEPLTRKFRDDVSFGAFPPSGQTRVILEGYCECTRSGNE